MCAALKLLGIGNDVQDIFKGSYHVDEIGNVVFEYPQNKLEVYGIGRHTVPKLALPWISHQHPLDSIRDVYLFESAIEALCFVQCHSAKVKNNNFEFSLFLSFGRFTIPQATEWVSENFSGRKFHFVFSNTLLGRVMDCRIAARLANTTVRISHYNETVFVDYHQQKFIFNEDGFTMDAFKKASGFTLRNARTLKPPKPYKTFKALLSTKLGDSLVNLGS